MEDPQFFRDLGSRFSALQRSHDPREELHALYCEATQEHRAQELGVMARQFMKTGHDEAAYECARAAGHVGRAALGGVTEWSAYALSGGPSDDTVRQSLRDQWSALATLGALAAGALASRDDARDAWLDLLRTRSPHYSELGGCSVIDGGEQFTSTGGIIERLCTASTEFCVLLEKDASVERSCVTHEARMGARDSRENLAKIATNITPVVAPSLAPRPVGKETLTVREAARVLSISEDTVRRMAARGEIELISVGPRLKRIPRSEIIRLRSTGKHPRR